MGDTTIQWTEKTWNPIRGCSVVSPGCVNCYAMKQAHRFSGDGRPYAGLTKQTKAGPQWSGKVMLAEDHLNDPLRWREPRRVFVNSMSDLFHESVPDEWIDRIFAVMALADHHTFQILTKRAKRMHDYLVKRDWGFAVNRIAKRVVHYNGFGEVVPPLRNVWLGVSAEDQKHADERIPLLLRTPAAIRFISAEPLLGPIDLTELPSFFDGENRPLMRLNALRGRHHCGPAVKDAESRLDWVIVGGESGNGARPFEVSWARSIVKQCAAAKVPCFVKQLGRVPLMSEDEWRAAPMTRLLNHLNVKHAPDGSGFVPLKLSDNKGGHPEDWPEDLRVREFPKVAA